MRVLDNSVPNHLVKANKKLMIVLFIVFTSVVFGFLLISPPHNWRGYLIVLILYLSVLFVAEYVMYKSIFWHFSKIKYTEEGVHLYRDKVKYLPKHRFIPLGKNIGIYPWKECSNFDYKL